MCKKNVQTGSTGYMHSSNMDGGEWISYWLLKESCWCYETEFEFRILMAWGKKLLLSLSVFAIMLRKRLPDGSKMKKRLCYVKFHKLFIY